ncbi:MAG TPA: phospholipase D-like domain-containing protein [Gaiellaceae bacterium]|nr:phospholipase D-like domain-containing protein [Gaiellaceae bacterium]
MAPILARRNRSMSSSIRIRTLTDGGQQAQEIARELAGFLAAARRSLDLAQYDFHLGEETAAVVCGALREAQARGVAVRIIYNVDHANPIPVPPPPEPDVQLIASLGVPAKAIAGVPDLMHHKFVVRDGESVWTGSTNWTDESWSRQENVIVTVDSAELAEAFALDFEELWRDGVVEQSGLVEPRPVEVGGAKVRPWFTPGFADALTHRIAKKIGHAERVRICSPVITSAPVLGTLAQLISDGRGDIAGCVDATQVDEVIYQWKAEAAVSWKLPLLERVLGGEFSGKRSEPWEPIGSVHDFMHAKVVVADDVVFVGSFNLSHSGEKNAENVLEIKEPELARQLSAYVDEVRRRYPAFGAGSDSAA